MIFAGHQLNIGGVLPMNVVLGNKDRNSILSVYDNKLSSHNASHTKPIVLTGNLFTVNSDKDMPKWMAQSLFKNAQQLYVMNFDIIISWIILIIAVTCYTLVCINKIYSFKFMDGNYNKHIEFIESIKNINSNLTQYKLLIMIFVLCLFYPFSCKYYESTPILSHFSLFFFETNNIIIQVMLLLLLIIYNVFTIQLALRIIKDGTYSIDIYKKQSLQMPSLQQSLIQSNGVNNQNQIKPTHQPCFFVANLQNDVQI